jgi:hypothetical protein
MNFAASQKPKSSPAHGIVSMVLLLAVMVIDTAAITSSSLTTGAIYLLIVGASSMLLLYSYCAKCPCRNNNCGHFLPGRLTRWLPKRKEGPYTPLDYAATVLAIALIILLPQLWLADKPLLLAISWGLLVISGIEITLFVCRGCENTYCPMRK